MRVGDGMSVLPFVVAGLCVLGVAAGGLSAWWAYRRTSLSARNFYLLAGGSLTLAALAAPARR